VDISEIFYKDEFVGSCEDTYFSKDKKIKYRVPVKEECKGYTIPEDINRFIELIYPNMVAYLQSRLGRIKVIDEIINNYIIYSLEKSKKGIVRYKLYNFKKGLEYYKWFLWNLNYYRFQYKTKLKKESKFISILEESTEKDKARGPFIVRSEFILKMQANQEKRVYLNQLQDFLEEYKYIHKEEDGIRGNIIHFFECRVEGFTDREIAREMRIKEKQVDTWDSFLKTILYQFDNELCIS
jgi:hypothetical protein